MSHTPKNDLESLPELLTVEEFREVARLSRSTAYDLIRTGAVESVKFGRAIRIPKRVLLPSRTPKKDAR